jgi:hypothetical protein
VCTRMGGSTMMQHGVKIAKLIKPVTLIIEISIKVYTGTYGYRRSSARVYLNGTEHVRIAMSYGGPEDLISSTRLELSQTLPKRYRPQYWQYFTDWQKVGVHFDTKICVGVKQAECRDWGNSV